MSKAGTLQKTFSDVWAVMKTHKSVIALTILTMLFFAFGAVLTWDSSHYLTYVAIFETDLPAASWDVVRGPVFPVMIFLSDVIFGKTNAGLLIGFFLFYLIFVIICLKICRELCAPYKHRKLIQTILLGVLVLNPLIFGYFHVLLTEFVAITVVMLNILFAYKWLSVGVENKKPAILYVVYFICSAVFCYHLKQPYVTIIFIPLVVAAIIAFVRQRNWKNALYRFGAVVAAGLVMLASAFAWNAVLRQVGADFSTGRDSSSMLGGQLLHAYQISYEREDGEPVSTAEAVGIILDYFRQDPAGILGVYLLNYCGLSSLCEISTENGVGYVPTTNLEFANTYENQIIAYAPFNVRPNLFTLSDELYGYASVYELNSQDKGFLGSVMRVLKYPTNVLFKVSILAVLPVLILLTCFKYKDKKNKYCYLFDLSVILLFTAFLHVTISAGIGLIIDRYAVEAFAPALLGIFGTITYCVFVAREKTTK